MKVLLWQDVDKVGNRGEVVEVKDGFARNYLFPRRLASKPTPSMYKQFELEKRKATKREAVLITDAKQLAEKLAGIASVSIEVNTNDEGHLYGAVNPSMIADALRDQGVKLEARVVEIAEPIKQVGTYEVVLRLHRDVASRLKVWVLSTKAVKPAGAKSEEKKTDAPPAP